LKNGAALQRPRLLEGLGIEHSAAAELGYSRIENALEYRRRDKA